MFSLKMKKLLITLIMVMVVVLALGSVKSLATQITVKPTNAVGETENNNTANNNTSNTNANKAANNTNTNSNSNKNAAKNNTSAYNNTNTKTGSLPYAGTNTSMVFVVIVFVASSLYAYKKVSDYNI